MTGVEPGLTADSAWRCRIVVWCEMIMDTCLKTIFSPLEDVQIAKAENFMLLILKVNMATKIKLKISRPRRVSIRYNAALG